MKEIKFVVAVPIDAMIDLARTHGFNVEDNSAESTDLAEVMRYIIAAGVEEELGESCEVVVKAITS
jgi:hypothetical protein